MPLVPRLEKLDGVLLDDGHKLWVDPEEMRVLDLKPGQAVDREAARKIIAENDRLTRFK